VTGPPAIIVSDLDVVGALVIADDLAVHQVAVTEAVTAPRDAPLREAAQVMAEHGVSHLIVLDEADGRPVGVLSTTDILAAYSAASHRPAS
jgi:CBS domain-containing protein